MPHFCERSIYWVLKYRKYPRKTLHKLYRYGFVDDHTPDTLKWTLSEAEKIEKIGTIPERGTNVGIGRLSGETPTAFCRNNVPNVHYEKMR